MGQAMKYFPKKILSHEIFFEKFVKPSGPPSHILNVRSLNETTTFPNPYINET